MKFVKNNWVKSLIINAIILFVVCISSDVLYENNDDFSIALRIVSGYPNVSFVHYFLCKLMILMQKTIPSVNIFILLQIISSFISFWIFLKIIFDNCKNKFLLAVSAFTVLLFSYDHYSMVSFTKTAALLMVVGTIVVIDSFASKIHTEKFNSYYILGFILIYLGISFRADAYIAAIGYAGIFFITWIIESLRNKEFKLKKDEYFEKKRIFIYVITAVILLGGFLWTGISEKFNTNTAELRTAGEYSEYRSYALDYMAYENYVKSNADWSHINIDENDLYLIKHWHLDFDGAASLDKLHEIHDAERSLNIGQKSTIRSALGSFKKNTVNDLRSFNMTGVHIMVMIITAIYVISSPYNKKSKWLYVILVGVFSLCIYIGIYYIGRDEYRALYVADIACVLWLIYFTSLNERKIVHKNENEAKNLKSIYKICAIMTCICISLLIYPVCKTCERYFNDNNARVMPKELKNYIDDNNKKLFVFSTYEKPASEYYAKPMKAPYQTEKNMINTGNWGTMTPYMTQTLAEKGISNPIRDLINNDKAYYIGNDYVDRLTIYYNKWYGKDGTIRMEKVDSIGGYGGVWKVKQTKIDD